MEEAMGLVALALAAAATTSAAPASKPDMNIFVGSLPAHCRLFHKAAKEASPAVRALGDLPSADQHLLVDRRVLGCPVPTIVRHNVDAGSVAPARPERLRPLGERSRRR
jgi:hypothetical protein